MRFKIIVTDITDYGADLHCVAGWDLLGKQMVRPEPAPRQFWPQRFVGADQVFWPGSVVEFEGDAPKDQTYPHATEDVVVQLGSLNRTHVIDLPTLPAAVAGSVAPNIEKLFAGQLRRNGWKGYVPLGSKCNSLGGIELKRADLEFREDQWQDDPPKLRAIVSKVNLSVTSTVLRAAFSSGGVEEVERLLPNQGTVHVRIGLARPFGDYPNECFLQVNGVYAIRAEP